MAAIIACALDIPGMADAAHARGMRLTGLDSQGMATADAAIMALERGDAATRVAALRGAGWTVPLLVLLPGDDAGGVTAALDAGADDAVALPASAGEIAARVAARLRPLQTIQIGSLRIDPVARAVWRGGQPVPLLPREYALLLHLVRAQGQCVGRRVLLAAVWRLGFDPGTNVVEVHVARLRARLDRGHAVPLIHTERGRGYRLVADR
ncbi:winged helix-turn-helix domain-containing protein [Sphingomonas sp. CJ20]